jgi:hypothetical protein
MMIADFDENKHVADDMARIEKAGKFKKDGKFNKRKIMTDNELLIEILQGIKIQIKQTGIITDILALQDETILPADKLKTMNGIKARMAMTKAISDRYC